MTHYHKIINTLLNRWKCYGQIVEENKYCQSLPRSVAKLREKLTGNSDISKGFIGVLNFEGKSYSWFERMDGKVKYFRLEEIQKPIISNVVNGKLFDTREFCEVG